MPVGHEENRKRFLPHVPSEESQKMVQQLSEAFLAFADYLDVALPDGRGKSTAMTWLKISSMWANYAVVEKDPINESVPPNPNEPQLF